MSKLSGPPGLGPQLRPSLFRGLHAAALDEKVPVRWLWGGAYIEAELLLGEIPLVDPDYSSGSSP